MVLIETRQGLDKVTSVFAKGSQYPGSLPSGGSTSSSNAVTATADFEPYLKSTKATSSGPLCTDTDPSKPESFIDGIRALLGGRSTRDDTGSGKAKGHRAHLRGKRWKIQLYGHQHEHETQRVDDDSAKDTPVYHTKAGEARL